LKPVPAIGSNPPAQQNLRIHNKSDYRLEFIVTWI